MDSNRIRHATRTGVLCKTILPGVLFLSCATGTLAGPAGTAAPAATPCACGVYSVINLDPEGAVHFLNQGGHAAIGSFVFGTSSYFDGDRLSAVGVPGDTFIKGLNNRGVVTGETSEGSGPLRRFYQFTWTLARGLRALPGLPLDVWDINDRNQVAADLAVPQGVRRAVRIEPNGAITPLGPLPQGVSAVRALADNGSSGGYADDGGAGLHAMLWDARGRATDLGTLGGNSAATLFVNERGEAAGTSSDAGNTQELGFFWSRASGMLPTGTANAGSRTVSGLNDRGEVVGDIQTAAGATTAYRWSRARGLVALPRAGAVESDVFGINIHGDMVGGLRRAGGWRAALWRGANAHNLGPVDLNARLQRIPAGLLLSHALAINDAGTILALSNTGLVMLRPGKVGTDAPVLGPFNGLPESASVGQEAQASLGFIDNAPGQVHTATVDWGDGCASPAPLVREAWGRGELGLRHRFCAPGLWTVSLRVTDSGGRSTEARTQVLVDAPDVAALSGRGTLTGTRAAGGAGLPLQYSVWAPLDQGAAGGKSAGDGAGQATLSLRGPFGFRSDSLALATRQGAGLRLEGTGRYNGRAGYRVQLDALGAGSAPGGRARMRVRISHRDAAGAEVLDYDSAGRAVGAAAVGAGVGAGTARAGADADGALSPVAGTLSLRDQVRGGVQRD